MRSILLPAILAVVSAFSIDAADLFHDDFSKFPSGWLTSPVGTLNAAIQEYHYLPNRGVPLGPWENAICHLDAWLTGDEDGRAYIEQHLAKDGVSQYTAPVFVTGDPEWRVYSVEVKLRPLDTRNMAGIVFRYHTSRHYYLFALAGGDQIRPALHLPMDKSCRVPDWKELGRAAFSYDVKRYYTLRVENDGPRIRAFVDGKLVLEASDSEVLNGKAGLSAESPARYQDFAVTAPDGAFGAIQSRIRAREAELARGQPAAETVEEVRYARIRCGAKRSLRRCRWRWRRRHAHRPECPARSWGCIRRNQLPHGCEP